MELIGCMNMKKVRSSQETILVLNWIKHSLSLWVFLFQGRANIVMFWMFANSKFLLCCIETGSEALMKSYVCTSIVMFSIMRFVKYLKFCENIATPCPFIVNWFSEVLISTIIPRSRYDHAVVGNAWQQKIKRFVILAQHPPYLFIILFCY